MTPALPLTAAGIFGSSFVVLGNEVGMKRFHLPVWIRFQFQLPKI